MWRVVKTFMKIVILACGTLALLWYLFFSHHQFFVKFLPAAINPFLKTSGFKLTQVTIERPEYIYPDKIYLKGVKVLALQKAAPYVMEASEVDVNFKPALDIKKLRLAFHVTDLSLKSQQFIVNGLSSNGQLTYPDGMAARLVGEAKVNSLQYNQFSLSAIILPFEIWPTRAVSRKATARFAGGQINSDIAVGFVKDTDYRVKGTFEDIDLERLSQDNRPLFNQMKGKVDGDFDVSGNSRTITAVKSYVHMQSGGQVKAEVFQYLLNFIPNSQQRQELELLVQRGEDIELDKGAINLTNVGEKSLNAGVELLSQKYNLDVQLKMDVNIDGGMSGLFFYLDQVSQIK